MVLHVFVVLLLVCLEFTRFMETRNSRANPSIVLYRSNRAEGAKPQRETETEDRSVRPQYGADGEKQRAKS